MFDKLRIFVELSKTCNVSKVAARRHLSQSAVSSQLATLERALGFPVFDRVGRSIQLNSDGERFLAIASRTIEDYDKLRETMHSTENIHESISFSSGGGFIPHYYPIVIKEFRKIYPDVEVEMSTRYSEDIIPSIEDYNFLIVASTQPIKLPQVKTDFCYDVPLYFVCHAKSPLVKLKEIKPEDVAGELLVLPQKGSDYREFLLKKLSMAKYEFADSLTIDDVETIKAATASGLGVTVLPHHVVQPEIDDGKLVHLPLAKVKLTRKLSCIHHTEHPLSLAAQKFISISMQILDLQPNMRRTKGY